MRRARIYLRQGATLLMNAKGGAVRQASILGKWILAEGEAAVLVTWTIVPSTVLGLGPYSI